MTDPRHSNPAMIPWKSYIQYAGIRSRQILDQRQAAADEFVEFDDDNGSTAIENRPCLVLHFSEGSVHHWFDAKGTWRIGRSQECEIVLPDQCVSRYHASIQMLAPGEFYLMDLNSYNGSFINGRRVREISRLYSGDRISLGQVDLEFYDGSPQVARYEAVTAERM
jgi:pSer/pThr/pTyr-binding forkhead associated (FHA) protein